MEKLHLSGYGKVSIEAVVKALGVQHVTVIKPFKVKKSIEAIRSAIEFDGVSVIISQEICSLYAKGLGELKDRVFTISDKCKNHRKCIDDLACPAFYIQSGRVKIDPDLCWGCAVCAQICPENAILPLRKKASGAET
jgi:indolepyruvate ferredoxin oxidoreductase alpha subunit